MVNKHETCIYSLDLTDPVTETLQNMLVDRLCPEYRERKYQEIQLGNQTASPLSWKDVTQIRARKDGGGRGTEG